MKKTASGETAEEMRNLTSRWLTAGGVKIHALAFVGGCQTTPVVLVCGLGVSSRYMVPAAAELARLRPTFCPDLPGFGASGKPDRAFDIVELAQSLAGVFDELEIDRADVVGHSFGCQIAAEFALRYPRKLERLVLAAPTGDPRVNSAVGYLGRLLLDAPREPFSLVPRAIADYFRAGVFRAWRTLSYSLRDSFEDKLPRIEAETLVIRGTRDPIVSPGWARTVAERLPRARLVQIEGAAHAVNYNSPVEFAGLINDFLRG